MYLIFLTNTLLFILTRKMYTMKHKISDRVWLLAARNIEGPEKHIKLESLVRFLARRAAEDDYATETAENRSDENQFKKDL